MTTRTVLIVGATGLIGSSALDHFLDAGWDVVTMSRRTPQSTSSHPFRHIAADLTDADAVARGIRANGPISHLVYAAVYEKPGLVAGWTEKDQQQTNLAMFDAVLRPLAASGSLRHVSLLQGAKAYGVHLHATRIPSRESEPRDPHDNFYWLQEDLLRELAADSDFAFTILRPQLVLGGAPGSAMNPLIPIAMYAALKRDRNEVAGFPGGPPFVWEATDARLIASALAWAAEDERARDQTFNLTNGDVFEWRDIWPSLMQTLGVSSGADDPVRLADYFDSHADDWARLVNENELAEPSMKRLLGESAFYADRCFASGSPSPFPPRFLSAVKIRQAGFTEFLDTRDSFEYWLRRLVHDRLVPGASE